MSKENTFELSNLYTTKRMDEGVWFEPKSGDISLGVRFKVVGVGSPKVINDYAKYTIDISNITSGKNIEDAISKHALVNAEFASKLVSDIETTDGRKIVSNGEEIKNLNSAMKELFKENTLVADLIIEFASNDFSFVAQE